MPLWTLVVIFTVFGACVGSFLNVCIWRMPRSGLTVNRPRRSHCPHCGSTIAVYDNVPLLSWLVLGGRCRSCDYPISIRYFLVEALTATLFGVLAYKYLSVEDARWGEFVALAALTAALIVASFIDMDLRILPDEITVGGMMLVPLVAVLVPEFHTRPADPWIWSALNALAPELESWAGGLPDGLRSLPVTVALIALGGGGGAVLGLFGFRAYWLLVHPRHPNRLRDGALAAVLIGTLLAGLVLVLLHPRFFLAPRAVSYVTSLVGMASGATLVLGVGIVGKMVFRKEAMGFGDVKLMGLLGGFGGWVGVLAGFALACLLGSLVGVWRLLLYRNRYLWFGPFLSLGCLIVIIFPEAMRVLLDWYLDLFR